jgi:His/Glu/Gln/Arg/opine family amino acid ABC transporter permease subunit
LIIAVGAAIIGIILGSVIAMIRVYHAQTGRAKIPDIFAGVYLAIFRGTPIVVQLLIMYYIIFTSVRNALLVAVISFGINSGAYVAEIVRAGILSIDIGQTEAGRSLGLPAFRTLMLIVLPQAIKNILPALGNEFVVLIKETSVASFITVRDLARAGANVRSATMEPYFSLFFVAIVYFILVFGVSKLFKMIERRLARSDRG